MTEKPYTPNDLQSLDDACVRAINNKLRANYDGVSAEVYLGDLCYAKETSVSGSAKPGTPHIQTTATYELVVPIERLVKDIRDMYGPVGWRIKWSGGHTVVFKKSLMNYKSLYKFALWFSIILTMFYFMVYDLI